MKPLNKISTDRNVTVIAKAIPKIPKKLPCLDVAGDDKPRRANINNTPEIKYKDAARLVVILLFFSFLFFCTFATFFVLPKNLQIYLLQLKILQKIQIY